jgi:hypothetical protein
VIAERRKVSCHVIGFVCRAVYNNNNNNNNNNNCCLQLQETSVNFAEIENYFQSISGVAFDNKAGKLPILTM